MLKRIIHFFKNDINLSPVLEQEFQLERAKFANEYSKFILKYIGWTFMLAFWIVDISINPEKASYGLILRLTFIPASYILYQFHKKGVPQKHIYMPYFSTCLVGALLLNILSIVVSDPRDSTNYFLGYYLISVILFIVVQIPLKQTIFLFLFLYVPHLFRIFHYDARLTNKISDSMNTIALIIFILSYRAFQLRNLRKEFLLEYEQKLNADIGKNISEISHDARAPLLALRSLQQGLFDAEAAKEILRLTTSRLIELVENITQAASQLAINIQDVNLKLFFDECREYVEFIHPQIQFHWNIKIENQFFPFDKNKIKRVIMNLINNSVSASKHIKNPTIKVEVAESKRLSVRVIDAGVGLEESQNGFSRGKSKFGSTGLGLSFVRRVTEEHSGHFSLSSSNSNTIAEIILNKRTTKN